MRYFFALTMLAASAWSALVQTPSFTLVQPEAGYDATQVFGLSGDGHNAVGRSVVQATAAFDSFTWSGTASRHDFSTIPGAVPGALVASISGNGLDAVGTKTFFPTTDHVFSYSQAGGYQNIGRMPGRQLDYVQGVNGDGSVIVGYGQNGGGTTVPTATPFRWTAAGGYQDLGTLHPNSQYVKANGVSRDGNVVIGTDEGDYVNGPLDAFRWTPQGGIQRLAPTVNAPFVETDARGISGNGLVVVGDGSTAAHQTRPWRWTQNTGMVDLGLPSGASFGVALFGSFDGSVIVGDMDIGPEQEVPFVWSEASGYGRLSDYLASNGAPLPSGYESFSVSGISDDAMTFAGNITLQNGDVRGFVATVPSPGALLGLGPVVLLFSRRRR